ncbi:MAG: hypothetical protein EBZ77_08245 [Chitinophagia bacterium]|nr:hypothetical protein [Chitinophagia bacterium]
MCTNNYGYHICGERPSALNSAAPLAGWRYYTITAPVAPYYSLPAGETTYAIANNADAPESLLSTGTIAPQNQSYTSVEHPFYLRIYTRYEGYYPTGQQYHAIQMADKSGQARY